MRATVTLPPALVRRADRLALRMRKTRDELFSEAVAEYLARHDPRAITNALNQLAKELDTELDAPAAAASRRVIERSKWEPRSRAPRRRGAKPRAGA